MLLPIPALAWSPILVLWFGLGNTTMIFITAFAAALPAISSTWTGVKTINPIWIRAAQSMNAEGMTLFWKVIFPGSLPFILSGIRIGLARAWRAGIGRRDGGRERTGAWATPSSTAAKTWTPHSCWWESRPSPWSAS